MSFTTPDGQEPKKKERKLHPLVQHALIEGNKVLHQLSEIQDRLAELEERAAKLARSLWHQQPNE